MVANPDTLSSRDIVVRGSMLAAVIAIPSIAAFLVSWHILDDYVVAAVIGGVVHFVAMGFSLRLSRRLHVRRYRGEDP